MSPRKEKTKSKKSSALKKTSSPKKTKAKKSKKSSKKVKNNLTISEMFFKQTRRPKPQSTASAVVVPLEPDEPEMEDPFADVVDTDRINNNNAKKGVTNNEKTETNNNIIREEELEKDEVFDSSKEGDASFESGPGIAPMGQDGDRSKEVKCNICDRWFPNRYFQRKHRLVEHDNQIYECRVCSFNSVEPLVLKRHILKMHVEKKEKTVSVTVEDLQKELESLMDRKVPRKVMMEDGVPLGREANTCMRFVCALCNRVYTSKYSLERHVRCHTLEKPFSCTVCDFTSSYREHMTRHMTSAHLIVHSDEPPVKPPPRKKIVRGEGPKKRRNIQRKRYECAVCGIKNSHKSFLMKHIKDTHPNAHIKSMAGAQSEMVHLIVTVPKKAPPVKRLTITCEFCSLIFHDTWKHKVHLRSHTGVKPFLCNMCDFKATSKMSVRDHIHRRHPDDLATAKIILRTVGIDGEVQEMELALPWKEFKCEYCSEVLKDNYTYKHHKKTVHTDELPFQCTECGFKSAAKAAMGIHCTEDHPGQELKNLILKNGKPLKATNLRLPTCEYCSKTFAYRSQLEIHVKHHTGEKAFSCEHCDYKSNNKMYMQKHMNAKHLSKSPSKKTSAGRRKSSKPRKRRPIKEEAPDDMESEPEEDLS